MIFSSLTSICSISFILENHKLAIPIDGACSNAIFNSENEKTIDIYLPPPPKYFASGFSQFPFNRYLLYIDFNLMPWTIYCCADIIQTQCRLGMWMRRNLLHVRIYGSPASRFIVPLQGGYYDFRVNWGI